MSKLKCTKHLSSGALLAVALLKKCTPLWREAHFQVKMYKKTSAPDYPYTHTDTLVFRYFKWHDPNWCIFFAGTPPHTTTILLDFRDSAQSAWEWDWLSEIVPSCVSPVGVWLVENPNKLVRYIYHKPIELGHHLVGHMFLGGFCSFKYIIFK